MRLIDADVLRKKIREFRDDMPQATARRYVCNSIMSVLGDENQTPTIEAEPVRHGRWVMTCYTTISKRGRVISNKKFACSECGYGNGRRQNNYCPNCNAKMDLEG